MQDYQNVRKAKSVWLCFLRTTLRRERKQVEVAEVIVLGRHWQNGWVQSQRPGDCRHQQDMWSRAVFTAQFLLLTLAPLKTP